MKPWAKTPLEGIHWLKGIGTMHTSFRFLIFSLSKAAPESQAFAHLVETLDHFDQDVNDAVAHTP